MNNALEVCCARHFQSRRLISPHVISGRRSCIASRRPLHGHGSTPVWQSASQLAWQSLWRFFLRRFGCSPITCKGGDYAATSISASLYGGHCCANGAFAGKHDGVCVLPVLL